jgi:hypothetical protein
VLLPTFAVVLFGASCGGGADAFGASISLPKDQFAMEEPIPITIILENVSSESKTVNSRLAVNDKEAPGPFREVTMRIKMPSGEEAMFRSDLKIGPPGPDDFQGLEPGQSIERTEDIAKLYFLDQRGEYEVTVVYENTESGPSVLDATSGQIMQEDIGAETGEDVSNTLTFTIE